MFKFLKEKDKLHCFSPEVMLATFFVEIAMAIYVFFRYRFSLISNIIILILVSLAVFQAVEYKICGGEAELYLIKIGFVAITLLPALGLHLISSIAKTHKFLVKIGYFLSFVFILYIIFSSTALGTAFCGGNYVIFNTSDYMDLPYGLYYVGVLFAGLWISIRGAFSNKKSTRKSKALFWILMGYLAFMFPVAMLYMWDRDFLTATTAIACGFAVIFAIILTFKVMPAYKNKK